MFRNKLILATFLSLVLVGQTASAAFVAKPGDLLRTPEDATVVLVMDDGSRVPISSDAYSVRYNNNFDLVKTVTLTERGSYNSDLLTLNSMSSLTSDSIFQYDFNQPGIFLVQNGYKRLFTTFGGFLAAGYNLNNVQWVGQFTLYPTGASVQ